jgi:hypothetical protein
MKNLYAVLFGLAVIVILVGFFELFIRLVYPEIKPHYTNRELIQINAYYDSNGLKPSYRGVSHGELIETDKMGFRLTFAKNDTSLNNWLYLGDSVTMGIGVSTDNTFAYLTDKRIRSIKIRNAGMIGHSTYDYVNATRHFSKKINISRITVFYCLNDVYSNFKEQTIPGSQIREFGGDILNFFKLNFRLYDIFKANIFDRSFAYFNFVSQYYHPNNPVFLSAVNDILSIKEHCDAHNIEFDVIIIPYEYQLRSSDKNDIFLPQRLLKSNLRAYDISIYDCANYFLKLGHESSYLYLYGDGIHFSEYGHQILSDYILGEVARKSDPLSIF